MIASSKKWGGKSEHPIICKNDGSRESLTATGE